MRADNWPKRELLGVRVCAREKCQGGDHNDAAWTEDKDIALAIPWNHVKPPSTEWRIHGYCSCECADMDEVEKEVERLRAVIEYAIDHLPHEHTGAVYEWTLRARAALGLEDDDAR